MKTCRPHKKGQYRPFGLYCPFCGLLLFVLAGTAAACHRAVHTVAAAAGAAFGAVGILIDTVERIEKAHTYYRQKNDILHDLMPP